MQEQFEQLRKVSLLFAISWSGGKDCCLAYWKAVSEGLDVQYLLNTYREDSGRVAFHGVRAELIQRQADAIGKALVQKTVGNDNYEEVFLGVLVELKSKGVEGMIFGDIDVRQNRKWCETVAGRAGLGSMFPLWNMDQKEIIEEFIGAGFKAIVVAIDSKFLTKDDLGRRIDQAWMRRIENLRREATDVPITFCGENGEYHTFVFGGPSFKSDIKVKTGDSVMRNGHWLIDVTNLP
jgi:uncharacterized protein (TIGR00290 family)